MSVVEETMSFERFAVYIKQIIGRLYIGYIFS